jgi:hypothetical protein
MDVIAYFCTVRVDLFVQKTVPFVDLLRLCFVHCYIVIFLYSHITIFQLTYFYPNFLNFFSSVHRLINVKRSFSIKIAHNPNYRQNDAFFPQI